METIERNNQAVRIIPTGDGFRALHLINIRDGLDRADVVQGKAHATLLCARKWAAKQLEAA